MSIFHTFHKRYTAVARFTQNGKTRVVLQCNKCGKYEVMPMLEMQQLRHNFIIEVDVTKIDMNP